MSKESTQQFEDFYNKIKGEYDDNKASSELNSDRLHNAAIMKLMLENSSEIFMFCGSLSIFRDQFYKDIAAFHGADTADLIRVEIAKVLAAFLADENHRLNVVLESEVNDLVSTMILDSDTVRSAINRGSLSLSSLSSKFLWGNTLSHFSYSKDSEMLRIEEDKIQHTGLYVSRNEELIKAAGKTYAMIKARSRAIA